MRKINFLVIAFLFGTTLAFAQAHVALGIKAGINLSRIDANVDNTENITAFHGGAFALFKLSKIGVQPELLFSQQGSKIEDIDISGDELKTSYMTIPVMVKLYLAGGFNLQAGPQFGFLNSAELDGNDVKDSLKSSDISANVGLAWDAPFGFVFDARYNIGLTDINDSNPDLGEVKSNVFQFSVGYKLFKFGK